MRRTVFVLVILSMLFSCKDSKTLVESKKEVSFSFVQDYSKIFTESQRDSLSQKLKQYELKTTNEIVIVTKDSISENTFSYSLDLFNEMGIGKADKNNGLLILLLKSQKHVRITTGYGTEKILTDSICRDIINKQMIPAFKEDNFYKGIDNALDEIILKWKE